MGSDHGMLVSSSVRLLSPTIHAVTSPQRRRRDR